MALWPDALTFADVWQRAVASRPDQTFLVFEGPDGHVAEWTYAEFDCAVGAGRGDVAHARCARRERGAPRAHQLAVVRRGVARGGPRSGAWIVPVGSDGSRARARRAHRAHPPAFVGVRIRAGRRVSRPRSQAAAAPAPYVIEVDEDDVDLAPFGGVELGDWPRRLAASTALR